MLWTQSSETGQIYLAVCRLSLDLSTCCWVLREVLKWLERRLVGRMVMTRLLLLMVGVGQRFHDLWADGRHCRLLLVIVEKSRGGLTQGVVDTPRTGGREGESTGAVGDPDWSWSWRGRLVMLRARVGEALGLHAVVGYRHPLTINREKAPPDSLTNVSADVVAPDLSPESKSVNRKSFYKIFIFFLIIINILTRSHDKVDIIVLTGPEFLEEEMPATILPGHWSSSDVWKSQKNFLVVRSCSFGNLENLSLGKI